MSVKPSVHAAVAVAPMSGQRAEPRHPGMAMLAIVAASALACVAILVESVAGWVAGPFHLLVVALLAAMAGLALAGYRSLGRQGDVEATIGGLERALEAANAANLAKSRYLTTISHEIRSPLNAIYGYAQLVEQDNESAGKAARVIRRSAEHLTSLVEGLLDIAQVENGVLRVRSETVRFSGFVEQIVSMMQPAASAKGLQLVYDAPTRLPDQVRMDQSRLRQVIINLLSNAIKFTDKGTITLRVAYSGQIATFDIIDTGPGIAPEDQDRIFQPFERAGDANTRRQSGAGMGLAISKAIIQILGGELQLTSTLGRGSRFRVKLMLGELAGQPVPEVRQYRPSAYEGPRRSILIVEDDAGQRSFLDYWLQALGFDVVALPNGEAAMELCGKRDFDLALLDIDLPGISGWDAATQLRARRGQDVRIVMLSANAQEFGHPSFRTAVHDRFLAKPFEFETMTRTIEELLGLSFICETAAPDVAPVLAAVTTERSLTDAAQAHVGRIRELLRIGHVRGIEAEIGYLAEQAPQAGALVDQLYGHLDRFDLGGMARVLEQVE